jgi:LysR family glycine cleavage system transcriptional activator
MAYRLPPLNALRAFEAAARHRSFKRAAEELFVTSTAVSHQIKALEAYLDVQLFRRLTRALELTPEGEAMLPKVSEGLECLAAAVERVRDRTAAGMLTVTAPPSFASRWLVPRLRGFTATHRDLELHIASSVKNIDTREQGAVPAMEAVDVREDASSVAIRFGNGRYSGFRVDPIFAPDFVPVCSPALLKGKRPLHAPNDLRFHVLIHDDTIPDESDRPSWEAWLKAAAASGVDPNAGPHFSDASLALEAARDGQGVALAPKPLVSAEIAAGRLVIPFGIAIPSRAAYYLVVPEALAGRSAVAAFRDWLLDEARKETS